MKGPYICLFSLCGCLSVCLSFFCLSVCLSVSEYLSVSLSVFVSVCFSVCLSLCLSVCVTKTTNDKQTKKRQTTKTIQFLERQPDSTERPFRLERVIASCPTFVAHTYIVNKQTNTNNKKKQIANRQGYEFRNKQMICIICKPVFASANKIAKLCQKKPYVFLATQTNALPCGQNSNKQTNIKTVLCRHKIAKHHLYIIIYI